MRLTQVASPDGQSGRTPPQMSPQGYPLVPMHPKMVAAIKASPKGVIPPGLAKYLAAKKLGKGTPKVAKKKKMKPESASLAAMEKKLGVVS